MLGICLKRYTYTANGAASKLSTRVDIPLEIALPHFVSDDRMEEEGPLFGNFKLSLQSVVCHRGVSVASGHYISLVRGETIHRRPTTSSDRNDSSEEDDEDTQWLRFDDLARDRVKVVDIKKALRDESPYLLFYQVQPIDEDLARGDPPSYSEATETKDEEDFIIANTSSESLVDIKQALPIPNNERKATESAQPTPDARPTRISIELPDAPSSDNRGRSSTDDRRRGSIVFVEKTSDNEDAKSSVTNGSNPASGSVTAVTAPTTPADESRTSWLGSRRSSKASNGNSVTARSAKSRPTSQSGDANRLSLTMSRLTGRISRDKLLGTSTGTTIAGQDRDFAGRAPEKEDALPTVEIAEVPASAPRSRSSTAATTPASLTPAASSAALDRVAAAAGPVGLEKAETTSGKLDAGVGAATAVGEKETMGRKSDDLGRPTKEKDKKGNVMRSRSRHLDKKKAKNPGEPPDRECVVM